jgi:methylglutaconyl-CoA hydratase
MKEHSMAPSVLLQFKKITESLPDELAIVSLNRPQAANAFNEDILLQLAQAFHTVKEREACRLLILTGKGKHFSAGADLNWMKEAKNLSYQDNVKGAEILSQMFSALYNLSIPTIAVIRGSVYGGACGLVACCDIALASEESRFALSEVKLGILPAVIFPYLQKKMHRGSLGHFALSGQVFSAQQARDCGLIQKIVPATQLNASLKDEINALLVAGPRAQQAMKKLIFTLEQPGKQNIQDLCCETIAKIRTEDEAQLGFTAFLNKSKAPWVCELAHDWILDESFL